MVLTSMNWELRSRGITRSAGSTGSGVGPKCTLKSGGLEKAAITPQRRLSQESCDIWGSMFRDQGTELTPQVRKEGGCRVRYPKWTSDSDKQLILLADLYCTEGRRLEADNEPEVLNDFHFWTGWTIKHTQKIKWLSNAIANDGIIEGSSDHKPQNVKRMIT